MMTLSPRDSARSKILGIVIADVLSAAQLTMVRELVTVEKHGFTPQPEDLLHWMRLNMPVAAQQVEDILHPNE